MNNQEYQWEIDLIIGRYGYLNLSFEQAEHIYKYEKENLIYSEKHFFSIWEDDDYQFWIFKHFLTGEQLVEYKKRRQENARSRPESIAEADSYYIRQIDHNQELLELYQVHFWKPFFADPFIYKAVGMFYEEKIKYLKASYRFFLSETRKEILTQHFRHNRDYAPNQLKNELVRHRLSYILPGVSDFKRNADEPTLAMAHYLIAKLKQLPEDAESFLTNSFAVMKPLAEQLMKKYYNDYPGGWHVITRSSTKEEQKEERLLLWLLMDQNQFGLEALYPY